MDQKKFTPFKIIVHTISLLIAFACLYPFLHMIAVSFSGDTYVMRGEVNLIPKGLTWANFNYVLGDPRILIGYKNTITYVVLGTTISLFLTSMGAYALSKRELIFRRAFLILIIFTILFGGGMIPTFLVVRELGLIDTIWAMIFPTAISTWYLIIMRTFFATTIPNELEEAAKLDGLNDIGIYFRIVLPLSKPVLAAIGLFYAVGIWNNFMSPLLYLRDNALFPLQIILRNMVLVEEMAESTGADAIVLQESVRYSTILVSTIPILLLYPFLQKYFVKGVMIGGLKG